MNRVPFLDLAAAHTELAAEIEAALVRVARSGRYIYGEEVSSFEQAWASHCGAKFCVGVGNGLDALTLALSALEIGPGDEVIVPSNTYIATWLAIAATGATPVPVEPNPDTSLIEPEQISNALSSRTRAIVPVHLYGNAADMDEIVSIARRKGLYVIEDAAQAHGATLGARPIGAHGDAVCWSFYPSKNLGALGDAGAVTTDSVDLATRIRRLANYGSADRNVHLEAGVNSRLDPMQAAVLSVRLNALSEWTSRRRARAAQYLEALKPCGLGLPCVPDRVDPVWHLFVVRVPGGRTVRDRLATSLSEAGVQTQIHYPTPPHMQPAFRGLGIGANELPIARSLADSVLSLPIGPHLSSGQADRVIDAVVEALRREARDAA